MDCSKCLISHFAGEVTLDIVLINRLLLGLEWLFLSACFLPLVQEGHFRVDKFANLGAFHLLVRCQVPVDQPGMVAQETQEHDSDDSAKEDDSEEVLLLLVQVSEDNPVGCLELLP